MRSSMTFIYYESQNEDENHKKHTIWYKTDVFFIGYASLSPHGLLYCSVLNLPCISNKQAKYIH